VVRLPFTRSADRNGLSTRPISVTRFSEPEGALPTSAMTTTHGHPLRVRRFLVLRREGDAPLARLRRALSIARQARGRARTDEPRSHAPEGACPPGPDRLEQGTRRLSACGWPLLEPALRTSLSCRARAREADPLPQSARHRTSRLAFRPTSRREGPRFPHRPAKGDAFGRDRGAFHRAALTTSPRGSLPALAVRASLHAVPAPRRTPTPCRSGEPAPLQPSVTPGVTCQATRRGSIEPREAGLASSVRTAQSQRPKRLP